MARKPNLLAREKILRAAYDLMHERGFESVSMDEVAAASGLKKANLFHYYPTKEQLGSAVFKKASGELRSDIEARCSDTEKDPVVAVGEMFDAFSAQMAAKGCRGGCFIGNLAQELGDRHESLRLQVADYLRFWAGELEGLLSRAQNRGVFRSGLDPAASAEAVLALLEGATLLAKSQRDVRPYRSAKLAACAYLAGMKN